MFLWLFVCVVRFKIFSFFIAVSLLLPNIFGSSPKPIWPEPIGLSVPQVEVILHGQLQNGFGLEIRRWLFGLNSNGSWRKCAQFDANPLSRLVFLWQPKDLLFQSLLGFFLCVHLSDTDLNLPPWMVWPPASQQVGAECKQQEKINGEKLMRVPGRYVWAFFFIFILKQLFFSLPGFETTFTFLGWFM